MQKWIRSALIALTLVVMAVSSCQKAPLKAGDIHNIEALIKKAQKQYVRESYGEWAHQCFTDLDYQAFIRNQRPQRIARGLKGNRKFMEAVMALKSLPDEEQAPFIEDLRRPLRPTWRQLGRISREGQTEAGQRAELDIANAVADVVWELSKLSNEDIGTMWQR